MVIWLGVIKLLLYIQGESQMRIFIILIMLPLSVIAKQPQLMLLQNYRNQDLSGWVMSEKLDGVRAFWDGSQLYSRKNRLLNPPSYFVEKFPPFAIDGELYSKPQDFENISAIVRSHKHQDWNKLKLHVFDVPNASGNLTTRLEVLRSYLKNNPNPYIVIIPQYPITNLLAVEKFLAEVISKGGEGIVVRNPNAPYEYKRSNQILKIKPVQDEECIVVGHHEGSGKFKGMMGALTCKNQRGTFKIGSGFNLQQRQNPPPINTVITYRYRGLTNKGLPRFATFYRVRSDQN